MGRYEWPELCVSCARSPLFVGLVLRIRIQLDQIRSDPIREIHFTAVSPRMAGGSKGENTKQTVSTTHSQ